MKIFRNMKIGIKIITIVTVLMIITLTIVGFTSFNSASDALFISYEGSLTTQAEQTAQILSDGLRFVKVSLWEAANDIQVCDESEFQSTLNSIMKEDGFAYLGYVGFDGTSLAADGDLIDFSEDTGYLLAVDGETVINRPIVWGDDNQLYLPVFAPVRNDSEDIQGVITAMVKYEDVYSLIGGITIGETGYAVVLDEQGTVTMHSVADKVITKENIIEMADSNPQLEQLKQISIKCINRQTGFSQYTYNGAVKYTSYAPIEGTGWALMLTVPKSELFSQINKLMYTILITSGIALVVILIVLLLFIRTQINKPLSDTTNLARALASGNLDESIEIKSNDEVGQISQTLDNEVRQAFKTIEENRVVTAKQSEYQAEQVDKLVVNLEKLAAGVLSCDMAVDEPDQDTEELYGVFNSISENLHLSVNTIKGYIDEISYTLSEVSGGNLVVEITSDYQGDFIALKDSINAIVESLNSILIDINTAAEQVASGTTQVSDGNQEISQGATEQASSIEELSSSITQMAEQIRQNATNATTSTELAIKSKDAANDGNEKMKGMLKSMEEINESSSNISKIIKVIDDIAFQTNILALNAAVEAARAGAHGKGFAVVAEEVRNLAARSANAANETTTLIEGSIKKVEAGTQIANETAGALSSIVSGAEESAELLKGIAVASNEQATGIAQINKGIEQLSQVVQTNSATAEEGAAASEELSSQAELLKSMIAKFTLKTDKGVKTISKNPAAKSGGAADYKKSQNSSSAKPKIVLNDSEFGKY